MQSESRTVESQKQTGNGVKKNPTKICKCGIFFVILQARSANVANGCRERHKARHCLRFPHCKQPTALFASGTPIL